jgi:hypothetical protein
LIISSYQSTLAHRAIRQFSRPKGKLRDLTKQLTEKSSANVGDFDVTQVLEELSHLTLLDESFVRISARKLYLQIIDQMCISPHPPWLDENFNDRISS